jgi:asparagine N-glycosylation enzyme membrane subunit Stt3
VVKPKAFRPILIGGLIAGTLDITYACVYSYVRRGTSPVTILQSVASGGLGPRAFTGGVKMAVLGGVFHFLIATIAAAVYYLASRQLRFLITQAVICGILFGVCVYLFMNFVVLPLSAIPFKMSYPWPSLIGGLLIHMFGIGLPIALVVRRYSK